MTDEQGRYLTYSTDGCPRCNSPAGHKDLRFEKLERQSRVGSTHLAYWVPCPSNGQPILMTLQFMRDHGILEADGELA